MLNNVPSQLCLSHNSPHWTYLYQEKLRKRQWAVLAFVQEVEVKEELTQ